MTGDQERRQFFQQVFASSWIVQGIWVAAELGIADLIVDAPQSTENLSRRTETHPGSLQRLLRALASVGLLSQDEAGRFSLTSLGQLLRTDVPGSQRAMAIMMGAEFHQAWGELLHSVRTGKPGFDTRFAQSFFAYMTERPERHRIYDAAMSCIHGVETEPMLDSYDFAQFGTVMDMGGGNGQNLAAILQRHPAVQGILFDLPAVAARAGDVISNAGLLDRCQVVGGDFFVSVPQGADAYVMRHILHDWEDSEAIAILKNCRRAMHAGSRLLVVEMVIPPGDQPCFAKWLDLMMLLVGGRERTEDEYGRLFAAAGLKLNRVVPTTAEVSLVEALPAL